jgi:two-component system, NarL family, sensor histidine kinase UhpB
VRRSATDGTPLDVEFRILEPGREPRWLRLAGRASRLHREAAGLVHGVVSDIEPRKRAEAERLDLLRRLGEAQENEQRRIARELHDQVGQTVTGLSLGLKGLERLLVTHGGPPEARRQVQWLQRLAGEVGRDIHRAAVDLRPTALDDLGLTESLATLLQDWGHRHGIRPDLEFLGEAARLPPGVESAVYRVVQEALTNVLKHARAVNVSVSVERRPDEVRLIIEDDGVGFDPDAGPDASRTMTAKPRLGLSGIRERLALLNGSLTLEASPGVGTTLFVRIPLPQAA